MLDSGGVGRRRGHLGAEQPARHVHRHVTAAFTGTIVTTAPSTQRAGELAIRADHAMGLLDEPTSVLLHQISAAGEWTAGASSDRPWASRKGWRLPTMELRQQRRPGVERRSTAASTPAGR